MAQGKDKNKELYSFVINTTKEVEEKIEETRDGDTVLVTKKVKKTVPTTISISRPTRKQVEEADLQYTIKLSELIRSGILTKAMLTKKYADVGGVLTQEEAMELAGKYKKLNDLQSEFVQLSIRRESSEEAQKKLNDVTEEINTLRYSIANIESSYSSLFSHTADVKASNHVILWYSLMLSSVEHESEDGKVTYTPVFNGETFEDKMKHYYEMEEELSEFYLKFKHKMAYFMSFWFAGAASDREDFEKLEQDIEEGKV